MTAVPDVTPVTTPFSSTVATSGLAELQVTLRSVTVQGSTAADRVTLLPLRRVTVSGEI